jgi:hypothetical protein
MIYLAYLLTTQVIMSSYIKSYALTTLLKSESIFDHDPEFELIM